FRVLGFGADVSGTNAIRYRRELAATRIIRRPVRIVLWTTATEDPEAPQIIGIDRRSSRASNSEDVSDTAERIIFDITLLGEVQHLADGLDGSRVCVLDRRWVGAVVQRQATIGRNEDQQVRPAGT